MAVRASESWRDIRARNDARCRRIVETASPLVIDDLDWEAVADHDIDAEALRSVIYMRDVEGFTDRDLVGLTAHRTTLGDPLIRDFLPLWRREEAGHTSALDRFLQSYAARRGVSIPARQQPPPAVAPLRERAVARIGGPVGAVVAAAHMAWGAANELLTLNGYRILADRCAHPVLKELVTRIAAQEARHFSFYLMQAEWRLAAHATVRRTLRRVLERAWTPVGVGDGYKSAAEFGEVLSFLGRDAEAKRAISRMYRRFAALPGFAGLHIYERAAARYAAA